MKRTRWIILVVLIAVVISITVIFALRARAIADLRAEIQRIEARKARLMEENERLKLQLARKDDLAYIEYLARRELGLILPGEEKYILIEP
jgi:cell division protein FtsL